MLFSLFGLKSTKSHLKQETFQNLVDEIILIVSNMIPSLKEILNEISNETVKLIKEEEKNKLIEDGDMILLKLYDIFTDLLISKIKTNSSIPDHEHKIGSLINKIKESRRIIESGLDDVDLNVFLTFKIKFDMMKLYVKKILETKKEIRILSLGPSQVGKTNLVKKLFSLDDSKIKLKGGLESDTTCIRTYKQTINEVNFSYVDCPGFFDSRGELKDKENTKEIFDFIKNNEIDVILWTTKINDIVDLKTKELLRNITQELGSNFWKKTIVNLTFANDLPPEEYYEDEICNGNGNGNYNENENDNSIKDLNAWSKYTSEKKKKWQEELRLISGLNLQVPITLIENNPRKIRIINQKGCLIDGTPIIETLMLEIFKIIDNNKIPIMFLTLAGDIDNTIHNQNQNSNNCYGKLTEQQLSLRDAVEKYKENKGNWFIRFLRWLGFIY